MSKSRSTATQALPEGTDDLRRLQLADISGIAGTSIETARRRIMPELLERGVVRRIGRAWYGRPSEIRDALLGRINASTSNRADQGIRTSTKRPSPRVIG